MRLARVSHACLLYRASSAHDCFLINRVAQLLDPRSIYTEQKVKEETKLSRPLTGLAPIYIYTQALNLLLFEVLVAVTVVVVKSPCILIATVGNPNTFSVRTPTNPNTFYVINPERGVVRCPQLVYTACNPGILTR